ncbi:hypothetical protein DMC30DRAFT_401961 [Rhodotorula diobovata]|uniref:Uncharacterized protein n=1 Tax=Rhodotorula diobovata TaxID=5288 RepID=A0A5C5FRE9_9BASI|nr:hypothetical protein DMC30DRAFT_401961 [Rhodotorula diobovata]
MGTRCVPGSRDVRRDGETCQGGSPRAFALSRSPSAPGQGAHTRTTARSIDAYITTPASPLAAPSLRPLAAPSLRPRATAPASRARSLAPEVRTRTASETAISSPAAGGCRPRTSAKSASRERVRAREGRRSHRRARGGIVGLLASAPPMRRASATDAAGQGRAQAAFGTRRTGRTCVGARARRLPQTGGTGQGAVVSSGG